MTNSESGMVKKNRAVRFLAFALAIIMMLGAFAVVPVLSVESEPEAEQNSGAHNNGEIIYEQDVLSITVDGEERTELEIYENEKVSIKAEGIIAAKYQWQILHPEKSGLWVDIYEETKETLDVSLALTGNMEQEDGKTYLRCVAYEADGAYVTDVLSVSTLEGSKPVDVPEIPKLNVETKNPHLVYADGDATTPEFVTVTIEYIRYAYVKQIDGTFVKEEMGQAISPYIASLKSGSESFRREIDNPTIIGYEAFLVVFDSEGKKLVECEDDKVVIDLEDITDDVTYRVEYHPAVVPYEVHYYFQNIYDDLYVEDSSIAETEFAEGETGTEPDAQYVLREVDGFTSLYYEPETIAADGSTVFNVYYERNYYLMEFDCNGGYGTDTLYVRYGTYISVPNPVYSGYAFKGWDLVRTSDNNVEDGVADILPTNMEAHSSAYKAIWAAADTKYTIAYWIKNEDGTNTFIASQDNISALSEQKVSAQDDNNKTTLGSLYVCGDNTTDHTHSNGCQFKNLKSSDFNYIDFVSADKNVEISGDGSTVVNVYYEYKTYTLKFYYAASNKNNTNTYYVVGGSTYYFGGQHGIDTYSSYNNYSTLQLLDRMFDQTAQIGLTSDEPVLNEDGQKRGYRSDYDSDGTRNYYYIAFDAKYGSDISGMWPCDVFDTVTMNSGYTTTATVNGVKWPGTEATVSAWNGEHHVYYSKNNSNETIKGKYEKLDYKLLYDSSFADSSTVSYMCFWENGAKCTWNIPELYRYNIYLETYSGQDTTGLETKTKNGIIYYLAESYNTCDNSSVGEQTQPSLVGYTSMGRDDTDLLAGSSEQAIAKPSEYYDSTVYAEGHNVNFYYDANPGQFDLINVDKSLFGDITVEIPYNTPINGLVAYKGLNDTQHTLDYSVDSMNNLQNNLYPSVYEPGAYSFEGWYTTPNCINGTKVDLVTLTMPDSNLTLYAKWETVEHNVYFHYLYTDIDFDDDGIDENKYWYTTGSDGKQFPEKYPIVVKHGALLGTTYSFTPTRDKYTFIGWFYMDEEGKKRFAPDSMEIREELHLFAEWQSGIDTQYEVTYVLKEDSTIDGIVYPKGTEIADVTNGHSTAGKTKTFTAKILNELYSEFSSASLFPTINSHSILMEEDMSENTYEFEYVIDEEVWYKVKYINKIDGTVLHEEKVASTNKAVVTEKFIPIKGYIPEKYYIRKVLASDGQIGSEGNVIEENEIIFYYSPDEDHGIYTIEYYREKLVWQDDGDSSNGDDEKYELIQSEIASADLIVNESANVIVVGSDKIKTYTGFTQTYSTVTEYTQSDGNYFDSEKRVENGEEISGKLSPAGLEFRIYYSRNTYPYVIKFMEYGTSNVLGYGKVTLDNHGNVLSVNTDSTIYTEADIQENNQKLKYEDSFTYTAPYSIKLGDYTYNFLTTTEQTKTVKVRTETVSDYSIVSNIKNNVLVFYYEMKKTPIEYHVVCTVPDLTDLNKVSVNKEYAATVDQIEGCDAYAATGFKFVGWYSDPSCEDEFAVNSAWVNGTYLKPEAIKIIAPTEDDSDGTNHYYALFEPIYGSLTIKNTGTDLSDHNFLFSIKGDDTNNRHINMVISISGEGSQTIEKLPIGDYIVTELTNWSWTYNLVASPAQPVEVKQDEVAAAEFTNSAKDVDWLNGEDNEDNLFKKD